MIDLAELDIAIARLEHQEVSFSSCAKLADLYAVRDHLMQNDQNTQSKHYNGQYSRRSESENGAYGNSDFLQLVSIKNAADVWPVMDELMETLRIVNNRVYESVMRKIEKSNLKSK